MRRRRRLRVKLKNIGRRESRCGRVNLRRRRKPEKNGAISLAEASSILDKYETGPSEI